MRLCSPLCGTTAPETTQTPQFPASTTARRAVAYNNACNTIPLDEAVRELAAASAEAIHRVGLQHAPWAPTFSVS